MDSSACDDLKAFERRFTEVVGAYRPSTTRWRILLVSVSLMTAISAWYWLRDPRTSAVSLLDSLLTHYAFTVSALTLILLFALGIHQRVMAPQIITSRMRNVLYDFNMTCDNNGKLILRPRPNNN